MGVLSFLGANDMDKEASRRAFAFVDAIYIANKKQAPLASSIRLIMIYLIMIYLLYSIFTQVYALNIPEYISCISFPIIIYIYYNIYI